MNKRPKYGAAQEFIYKAWHSLTLECLEWPYSRNAHGYGILKYKGKSWLANRLVCNLRHGSPPTPKHHAAHSCGNRLCCNPAHLRWATATENAADKIVQGRNTGLRGEKHGRVKLSEADVRRIRELLPHASQAEIGRIYSVSKTTIGAIATGQNWGWLE